MSQTYKVRVLDPLRDLPGVAALLESEVPVYAGTKKSAAEYEAHLHWLVRENPDRDRWPGGWVLESSAGEIAGVHLSVPRIFSGPEGRVPFFFSCYYFVKAEARGMESLGLYLSYRKLAAEGVLMASSANAHSAPLWQKMGGQTVPGTETEYLKPLSLRPLAEEALHRRLGFRLPFSRARNDWTLPPPSPVPGLHWLRSAEEIAGAALEPSSGDLSPVRSAAWLRWKFLRTGAGAARLYRWDGGAAPVFVAVALSVRGWRGQIRCLQITDAWTARGPCSAPALQAVVASHRRHVDAVTVRGLGSLVSAAQSLRWRPRGLAAPMFWWSPAHAAGMTALAELYPDSGA